MNDVTWSAADREYRSFVWGTFEAAWAGALTRRLGVARGARSYWVSVGARW